MLSEKAYFRRIHVLLCSGVVFSLLFFSLILLNCTIAGLFCIIFTIVCVRIVCTFNYLTD